VKPAYDNYVLPSQRHADIIVPGSNNTVAIDLICTHIRRKLMERSTHFRQKMAVPHLYTSPSGTAIPECKLEDLGLTILPQTRHMAEEAWVFLLDAQIGTAAAAFMAIRILLDHGVKPEHIIFVTFLVARGGGVSVLRRAFPAVKIVTAGVDDIMQEGWLNGSQGEENPHGRHIWAMLPGLGQIGDRYYL